MAVCVLAIAACGSSGPSNSKSAPVPRRRGRRVHARNGIPNVPDPTFSGRQTALNLGAGINPSSPAFHHAARACGLNNP
jgi:hypothetical protein